MRSDEQPAADEAPKVEQHDEDKGSDKDNEPPNQEMDIADDHEQPSNKHGIATEKVAKRAGTLNKSVSAPPDPGATPM